MARIYLGNVKGPKGDTGATGATGPQGEAATIEVGSISTTAYGNAAQVTNVGSSGAAKFNFVIPQGKPGEKTTKMGELTLDTVTTSAEEFPVPAVGENGATVWGKVIKWFADGLAAIRSKLDANKVVNSQAVTEAGYALDAQQANPNVSGSLAAQISELNDSFADLISTGTATTNTSVCTGTCKWTKIGRILFISIEDLKITTQIADNTTALFSNLPTASSKVFLAQQYNTGVSKRFAFASQKITAWYDTLPVSAYQYYTLIAVI